MAVRNRRTAALTALGPPVPPRQVVPTALADVIEGVQYQQEDLCRKMKAQIDAVTISLPDHQHAEVALRALRAGKDVYLQKPFTMTHAEGVMLRDAVAKSGRILQVGSQQRSWGPNEQFRKAVEFVRSGRVGQLRRVEIGLPIDPTAPDETTGVYVKPPAEFDDDLAKLVNYQRPIGKHRHQSAGKSRITAHAQH